MTTPMDRFQKRQQAALERQEEQRRLEEVRRERDAARAAGSPTDRSLPPRPPAVPHAAVPHEESVHVTLRDTVQPMAETPAAQDEVRMAAATRDLPSTAVVLRHGEDVSRPLQARAATWDVKTPCLGCTHVSVCAIKEQLERWRSTLTAQLPVVPNPALSARASLTIDCLFFSPVKRPGRPRGEGKGGEWTPERRAAQAEHMRRLRAEGKV